MLFWIIETFVRLKEYLRLKISLKTLLTNIRNSAKKATPIQNHMQNPQPVIFQFANLPPGGLQIPTDALNS